LIFAPTQRWITAPGKTPHRCGSPQLWSRSISLTHRVFHKYLSENTTTGSANVENNHDLSPDFL
jgi:hypothetical protein